jgi:GxxExxY protein
LIASIKRQITVIKDRDPLTEKVIACAYKVHRELGPGFNEGIYHNALKLALEEDGLRFHTEKSLRVSFRGKHIGRLRLDLVIEGKVIIEVKALTGNLPAVFESLRVIFPAARGEFVIPAKAGIQKTILDSVSSTE